MELNTHFMSYVFFKADILFYQRFLKANGFYTDKLDGQWGKKTDAADTAFVTQSIAIAVKFHKVVDST
jgi:hypothetical protein